MSDGEYIVEQTRGIWHASTRFRGKRIVAASTDRASSIAQLRAAISELMKRPVK